MSKINDLIVAGVGTVLSWETLRFIGHKVGRKSNKRSVNSVLDYVDARTKGMTPIEIGGRIMLRTKYAPIVRSLLWLAKKLSVSTVNEPDKFRQQVEAMVRTNRITRDEAADILRQPTEAQRMALLGTVLRQDEVKSERLTVNQWQQQTAAALQRDDEPDTIIQRL